MTTPDPSRAAFEKWYSNDGENALSLERVKDGRYRFAPTACCWDAWQAAMAHKGADFWQPIETAPRDGTKFLAYRPLAHLTHDPHIRVVKGTPHNYGCWEATVPPGYSLENFTDGACRATHWQPLPAAPKQEGST